MKKRFKTAVILTMVFVFAICTEQSQAQMFKGYAVAGLNAAQIDGDEVFGYNKIAPQVGIGIMVPFNMRKPYQGWQASMEILFSQRGAKETLDPFAYKATLSYIDIPVMLHYIDTKGGWTFGLGLQYGRLIKISEDWGLPDSVISGFERPFDFPPAPNFLKNDLDIVAEIRFTVWEKFKFSFRYQYLLMPIRKDVWFYNGMAAGTPSYESWSRDFKNNYLSFRIIYVFNERNSRELDRNINRTSY